MAYRKLRVRNPTSGWDVVGDPRLSLVQAHGTVGATEDIDPAERWVHTLTLDENCTATLLEPPHAGACSLLLWVTQDGSGGNTLTIDADGGSVEGDISAHTTTADETFRVICERIPGSTNDWVCDLVGAGGGSFSGDAEDVTFDPTGLDVITATDVQGALEELDAAVDGLGGGGSIGRVHQVLINGAAVTSAPTNSEALSTSGGTLLLPFDVPAPMRLSTYYLHSRDTANARAAEARLYYYDGSALTFVTGTDATFSFTPTVASDRSASLSGGPVLLAPGAYWLAIRNTSGSQTFSVGYNDVSGTHWNTSTMHYTQNLGSALGSTLTTSGWSAGARLHAVRLRSPFDFT